MCAERSPESNIIKVSSDGTCTWWPLFGVSESHCPVYVKWFPFDTQICRLSYELYRYPNTDVNMTSREHSSVMLHMHQTSDEWEMLGLLTYN